MVWTVEALNEAVLAELAALPKDMRAKFEHITLMIENFGLQGMREPYVKHLDGSLWEMRLIGRDGIARAIYVTAASKRSSLCGSSAKRRRRPRVVKLNWLSNGPRRSNEHDPIVQAVR